MIIQEHLKSIKMGITCQIEFVKSSQPNGKVYFFTTVNGTLVHGTISENISEAHEWFSEIIENKTWNGHEILERETIKVEK